jgi:hypothetical protein
VKNDELSYNLGETVDRLISVQYFMSGGGSALTRKPVTGVLYEAAREKAGAPLCHLAAKALADMLAVRVVPRWYKDSIMGPSQKWIHERSFAEDLVSRWAKSIIDSEKEFFPK